MNTKILMISTALILGVCGILFQIMPHEILKFEGIEEIGITPLFVRIIGALYVSFALMNWTARSAFINSIDARSLVIGNFAHFLIGSFVLMRYVFTKQHLLSVWFAAAIYLLFAVSFGIIFFKYSPKSNRFYKK